MARQLICRHPLIVAFLILAAIIVVSLIMAHAAAIMTSPHALVESGRITFYSVWHG